MDNNDRIKEAINNIGQDTENGPLSAEELELLKKTEQLEKEYNEQKRVAANTISINDKVEVGPDQPDFQAAIDTAAEERARTPMEVSMMTHARMYGPFVEGLEHVSGGAAKRILRYMVGYPFFVDKLNPQDKQVETLAYMADKLGQTKFTICMIQAIENEAKAMQTLAEHAPIAEMDLEGKKEEVENE